MLAKIDSLPHPTPFTCKVVESTGNLLDDDGKPIVEELELWKRDVVDCIAELLGDPAFSGEMVFEPSRVWANKTKRRRIYGETWSGDWWWETQVRISLC